ncbi:MAG: metallophosphoesterase, partial [Candidatus Aminicenantes bacterium]
PQLNRMKNRFIKDMMKKIITILVFTFFISFTLFNLHAEDIQCIWTDVEKIIAIGDLHGDYESFLNILQQTRIIDKEHHWIAGKVHLVQIGDIFDRGSQPKEILNLLMKLEKEAEEAGGKVHVLIGNHEMINIAGRAFDFTGYVSLGQFVSFLPGKYKEEIETKFRKSLGENSPTETSSNSSFDPNLEVEWRKFLKDATSSRNHPARRKYFQNLIEKYGEWIINKNAVIKINDIIFVHGGLNEKYSKRKLKDLNKAIQKEMKSLAAATKSSFSRNVQSRIVYDSNGPLWYRELAHGEEKYFLDEVDRILKNLKARYMVIAHTPKLIDNKDDMKRFNGKIWIIDTGISTVYRNGRQSALIVENGEFKPWLGVPRKRKPTSSEDTIQFQEGICINNIALYSFLNALPRQ